MNEAQHRFWDIALKAVTAAALVGGGIWALYEHFDTEKQKVNATFWNKRMELYLQTSEVAAYIASANSPEQAKNEFNAFWKLYYGPMSVIEDGPVKNEMQRFAGLVRAFQGPGYASTGAETKPISSEYDNLPADALHQKKKDGAKTLADVMHASLKESWAKPFAQ
jgi:hypothetical protein